MAPMAAFRERGGHASGGVAEKMNGRNSGKKAGLPEDKIGMEMADDGMLDLRKLAADDFIAPEKRESGRVMAEKEHLLGGLQRSESAADFIEMLFTQSPPFGALL